MLLKKLYKWLINLFRLRKSKVNFRYQLHFVSEFPKHIDSYILYVEGKEEINDYWYAMMKCPCGCNENIMLNLMDDVRPLWELSFGKSDFSITPSIWRTENCKSHFWLTDGNIIWA